MRQRQDGAGEPRPVPDPADAVRAADGRVQAEKRTAKHSRNSSLPSSQTDKDDDTAVRPGAKGKGKSEQAALAGNTRIRETVTVAAVEFCEVCGEDLSETPCQGHERRTKIDILFEKVVEHVDAQIKQCPVCGATIKGRFPCDLHGPRQYGDLPRQTTVGFLAVSP